MSEDGRGSGIGRVRRLGALPRIRRVGEPNVLSDAATPNQLSTQISAPPAVRGGRREGPANALVTGEVAARPRSRFPAATTLIFLGFVALTAFRLVNEFADGLGTETPAASQAVAPGPVTFGTAVGDDCSVTSATGQFSAGSEVWWSAELATEQDRNADAMVVVRRDGLEIDREYVPADPSVGRWNLLCASAPVSERSPGTYRVEVWDGDMAILHAAGEYRVVSN
jgi:hypothetical protein